MRYYNYWDGDYFVRHMMMSALKAEGWSFSTISGARRLPLEGLREFAVAELKKAGANLDEISGFPSSIEIDLFAERGNEVLAIEIKTRLFARIRAEKVGTGFHHSSMHFGTPELAYKALKLLQGNKAYDQNQDEMGTICEFYRYLLALNYYSERFIGDVGPQKPLFNQIVSLGEQRNFKTAILVPFYCDISERQHIISCLNQLQTLLLNQRLEPYPVSLWVLTPTSKLINDADQPPSLRIDLFDKNGGGLSSPPLITPKDIKYAYDLTQHRGKYRGCAKCSYRKVCLSLEKDGNAINEKAAGL
jgi:hypothetical protein